MILPESHLKQPRLGKAKATLRGCYVLYSLGVLANLITIPCRRFLSAVIEVAKTAEPAFSVLLTDVLRHGGTPFVRGDSLFKLSVKYR